MKSPRKSIRVRIGNMTYSLTADENVEQMRDVAATADAMIEQVSRNNPGLNQTSTSVLALVNAVSMMQDAYELTKDAYEQRDVAIESKEEIKAELSRLREQFWSMKKDLLYYRNLCDVYESRLAKMASSADAGFSGGQQQKDSRRRRKPQVIDDRQTIIDEVKKLKNSEHVNNKNKVDKE